MATVSAGIPDDWEHVDDNDNFSVISFPTSEDDTIVPELSASDLELPCHQAQSEGLTRNEPYPRDTDGDSSKDQPNERCATNMTDNVAQSTPRISSRERVNSDSDLNTICETTNSLAALIPEILASEYPPTISRYIADGITARCLAINLHLDRLQNILNGYAKHRGLGSRLAELPVGLSEWLENLKAELLNIQETLNDPTTQGLSPTPLLQVSRSRAHYENLMGFCNQMDGLMAVIQSDYEDFHTLHMPMLGPAEKDICTPNRRGYPRPYNRTSGNHNLAHLRRELYTLKDQIVACLGEIHYCEHRGISGSSEQRKTMAALTLNYKKTKEALERMLSNHGCDWIDYSVAGGLTYPEFCRLNTDTIRSLILQLKEVTDDLFLERCRAESISRRNNPSGISEDEELVKINSTTMNTLQTIEELLVSILQIGKSV